MSYLDSVEATRGDIAELRHEMQLADARRDAQLATLEGKLTGLIAGVEGKLIGLIAATEGRLEASIQRGLREQTRFFFVAWSVILAFVVGLYTR